MSDGQWLVEHPPVGVGVIRMRMHLGQEFEFEVLMIRLQAGEDDLGHGRGESVCQVSPVQLPLGRNPVSSEVTA